MDVGKYEPLGIFLRDQRTPEVPLTFDEIEKITGVNLPPKAQHHRAWWSNNASNNVMTKVWLEAGYESTQVDISARKLVFRRVRGATATPPSPGEKPFHPLYGYMQGLVRIMPGTDLTQPADPEWGDRLDELYGKDKREE